MLRMAMFALILLIALTIGGCQGTETEQDVDTMTGAAPRIRPEDFIEVDAITQAAPKVESIDANDKE